MKLILKLIHLYDSFQISTLKPRLKHKRLICRICQDVVRVQLSKISVNLRRTLKPLRSQPSLVPARPDIIRVIIAHLIRRLLQSLAKRVLTWLDLLAIVIVIPVLVELRFIKTVVHNQPINLPLLFLSLKRLGYHRPISQVLKRYFLKVVILLSFQVRA